ncbi:hypothetical protein ES703_68228 [subsurface metagenome]
MISSNLKNLWINGESSKTGMVIIIDTMKRFLKSATICW